MGERAPGPGPSGVEMRAAWYERTGPAARVLEVGRLPVPRPGPGEVRVRVHVSGINPSDAKRRAGWLGLRMTHARVVPHGDGAGVIEEVGAGVPPERVGERVWLWNAQGGARPFGTAAEHVVVPDLQAVVLPGCASFETGAGLGVPGCTAHYAVLGDGPVGGQTILVQGGAGAVGHLAIQVAVRSGARVIATASCGEKAAIARDAGAEATVEYRRVDVAARVRSLTDGAGVDRVVEVDLAANLATDIEALREGGTIASYSSTSDPTPELPYYALAFRDLRIHFVQGFLIPPSARRAAIRDLTRWLAAGRLEVRIDATYPLERIAEAHERVESGAARGKVLVTLDADSGAADAVP